MVQALNYKTAAITDLRELREKPNVHEFDKHGIDFICDLLMRAEVFVLPERGELLDRSKLRPEVPGLMFHPPFPVVALEYHSSNRSGAKSDPVFEVTPCSKRIALAWEWDGKMPKGFPPHPAPALGEGVCIASLAYVDQLKMWIPFSGAILIPFDCKYETAPHLPEHALSMLKNGRISAKQASAPKIEIRGVLPLMPHWLQQLSAQRGIGGALELLSADLMDEVNAYLDLSIALACNNVDASRVEQPAKLNKARIKRGKPPFADFHVLTIGGEAYGGAGDGTSHDGVRSHLRRGHIRRLGPDRVTWVNATIVNGSRSGFVDKVYAPRADAA